MKLLMIIVLISCSGCGLVGSQKYTWEPVDIASKNEWQAYTDCRVKASQADLIYRGPRDRFINICMRGEGYKKVRVE